MAKTGIARGRNSRQAMVRRCERSAERHSIEQNCKRTVGHTSIPRTRLTGVLLTLVGVIVVSPDSVLIRLINADMWTILMCRSLLGAVGLLVISVVMEKPIGLKGFRRIGIPGLALSVSYVGCTMCFVYAVTHTTVANALVIMSISPVLGALMSRVVLGEPVGVRTWLGATVILLGLIIIFRNSLNRDSINGDMAALGAAFLLATKFVIVRRSKEISMVPAVVIGCLLTGLIAAPMALPLSLTPQGFWFALLLGLVLVPLGTTMTTLGPRYLPVPESGLIMLLEVLLAPLWAWLVIREIPSDQTLVGGIVILLALIFVFSGAFSRLRPSAD